MISESCNDTPPPPSLKSFPARDEQSRNIATAPMFGVVEDLKSEGWLYVPQAAPSRLIHSRHAVGLDIHNTTLSLHVSSLSTVSFTK